MRPLLSVNAKRSWGLLGASISCLGLGCALSEPRPTRHAAHRTVESRPIEPLEVGAALTREGCHSSQTMIKKWRVLQNNQSSEGLSPALQLSVSVPTLLFVRRDGSPHAQSKQTQRTLDRTIARIEFTGNNEQLLDAIAIETQGNELLCIGFEPQSKVEGMLMGEIFLGPGVPLTAVSLRGDTLLVIQDEQVFPDAAKEQEEDGEVHPLTINTRGDTRLLVSLPEHQRLQFHSMDLHTTGDSVVQLDTPALQIDSKLDLDAGGDAQVLLRTQSAEVHGAVTANVRGDANVRVASSALCLAHELEVNARGDGEVYFGARKGQSSCPNARIAARGDAQIDLGALHCANGSVQSRGDARVALQVTDTLQVHAGSDSSVQIVGKFPHVVEPLPGAEVDPRKASKRCRVSPAVNYPVDQDPSDFASNKLRPLPAPVPMRVRANKSMKLHLSLSSLMGY